MSFDKTVNARVWGTTGTATSVRLPVGDSSGGTFTRQENPLRGTILWDRCMYVLTGVSLTGTTVTAGSFSITVETDAIAGFTALPIARAAGIGFNSVRTIPMINLHNSAASALPTHLNITRSAGSGTITLQCFAIARQYRGTFGTPGTASAERVIQGTMLRGTAEGGFADSRGFNEDSTVTLGTTGSALGMHRMRLWDNALFWAVAGNTVAGTHNVDIISSIGGVTFSIAGTTTGTAGVISAAGDKIALASNFGGQSPNPTHIIWTEVNAGGVSDARVVVLAKSGRGSMGKF